MKKFKFTLLTPEKVAYDDDIESITVMTESGQVTIFCDHERLNTVVVPGELVITKESVVHNMVVGQGVLCIYGDHVELLANTTEVAADIDIERAKAALERAEMAMKDMNDEEQMDYARLEATIARNLARIKIGSKYQ